MTKDSIVFLADHTYYKNMNARVCYDFITHVRDYSREYNITIFWTDDDVYRVYDEILLLHPKLIVVFEINNFQPRTKNFEFIFSINVPVYLFLDDTYYINRNTSTCEYSCRTNGLIFWYKNDKALRSYQRVFPDKTITHVDSRFVNTNVFRNWGLEKKYDILMYGSRIYHYEYKREQNDAIQDYIKQYEQHNQVEVTTDTKISFYPLRCKLISVLEKLKSKYNIKVVDEACYDSSLANEELSQLINQSYLTITCSSIADVLLHKYLEISASNSVILGDIPSDYTGLFAGNVVELNSFMDDAQIIAIIDNALADKPRLLEMGARLCDRVHEHHNLKKASESFTRVLDQLCAK